MKSNLSLKFHRAHLSTGLPFVPGRGDKDDYVLKTLYEEFPDLTEGGGSSYFIQKKENKIYKRNWKKVVGAIGAAGLILGMGCLSGCIEEPFQKNVEGSVTEESLCMGELDNHSDGIYILKLKDVDVSVEPEYYIPHDQWIPITKSRTHFHEVYFYESDGFDLDKMEKNIENGDFVNVLVEGRDGKLIAIENAKVNSG